MSSATATILGIVSEDPNISTVGDKRVARFRIGWNRKVKGETKWSNMSVTFWGNTVDVIEQYVSKGSTVCVTGELEEQSWEKGGEKRHAIVLTGFKLTLEGKPRDKSDNDEKPQARPQNKKPAATSAKPKASSGSDFPSDDEFGDIPF